MNENKRRLRDDVAQGQPINKPVPSHHRSQPIYSDDSKEEEDFLFGNHQPARGVIDMSMTTKEMMLTSN